jgi:prolyl-tRNA synthetase
VRRFVSEREGESEAEARKRRKAFLPRGEALASLPRLLAEMQDELLQRARALRERRSRVIDSLEEFEAFFKGEGGFAWVHWAGGAEGEEQMAKRFETTIRCLPLEGQTPPSARGEGKCILTGRPSSQRVVMAKAY